MMTTNMHILKFPNGKPSLGLQFSQLGSQFSLTFQLMLSRYYVSLVFFLANSLVYQNLQKSHLSSIMERYGLALQVVAGGRQGLENTDCIHQYCFASNCGECCRTCQCCYVCRERQISKQLEIANHFQYLFSQYSFAKLLFVFLQDISLGVAIGSSTQISMFVVGCSTICCSLSLI